MKITVGEAVKSGEAMGALSKMKLPTALAYDVAMVMQALKAPIAAFEQARLKLLEEVGTPVESQPGNFMIKDQEKFTTEMKELESREITLDQEPISLDKLGLASIEPEVLFHLGWLICKAAPQPSTER